MIPFKQINGSHVLLICSFSVCLTVIPSLFLYNCASKVAGYHNHSGSNRPTEFSSVPVHPLLVDPPTQQQHVPHTGVVLWFTPSFKSVVKQLWTWRNSAPDSCSGLYVLSVALSLASAYMDSSSRGPLEDGLPFRPTPGEFSLEASVEWELACDVRRR